ncbi:hypothetical protein BV22DRAFT_1132656 [Leucogyrophana mollusca]|uniref:Uncharacterized protein n=1 Tax=Leucogyrophana mollusca TaxID=85980 RepID=A0ACB8B718_9AGAM|nr:hypothetical protein BV22DRAFT_1132656 [Leucogyrophana mollusca]
MSYQCIGRPSLDDTAPTGNGSLPHSRSSHWPSFLRGTCYTLHIVLVALHLCLVGFAFHHTEHTVIIPITAHTSVLTTALSASLQAFYTLYTALLVYVTQRVSLLRRLSQRQMLTTVHDVTGAWSGLGAAFDTLWQQTKVVASPLGVFSVTAYLLGITALHITSSSILQFQNFNSTLTTSVPTAVGWPDPSVSFTGFNWSTIASLAPFVKNLSGFSNAGLANGTVYDVLLDSASGTGNTTVNATSVTTSCAVVSGWNYEPNGTYLYIYTDEMDMVGSALFSIPWKDQVLWLDTKGDGFNENVLTFIVTTALNGSSALLDSAVVPLNWTYVLLPPNSSNGILSGPFSSELKMFVVSCNTSLVSTSAIVDVRSNELLSVAFQGPLSSSWTIASLSSMYFRTREVANDTWLSSLYLSQRMLDALLPTICTASEEGCAGYQPGVLDVYLMRSLGMNASQINPASYTTFPINTGNTTPSFTLSVDQMEMGLSRVLATAIWTAGQLGEASGGFNHSIGSATITEPVLEMRLNINWIPLLLALAASIVLLVLAIQMTCVGSGEPRRSNLVNNTGVLELIWLASRLPELRDGIGEVEDPNTDDLRAAGMFNVLLANINGKHQKANLDDRNEINYQITEVFYCSLDTPWTSMVEPRYTSVPKEESESALGPGHETSQMSDDGMHPFPGVFLTSPPIV